eukprot:3623113-Pyramimonas_sp.AAC.2
MDHSICVLRDALCFTSVIDGWGPMASPLIVRRTTHLEDASGILRFIVSVPRLTLGVYTRPSDSRTAGRTSPKRHGYIPL